MKQNANTGIARKMNTISLEPCASIRVVSAPYYKLSQMKHLKNEKWYKFSHLDCQPHGQATRQWEYVVGIADSQVREPKQTTVLHALHRHFGHPS